MIPKDCKRLAEVDFPIAQVSKHAAREKSIRHGHPSTLHLWWARRPLASCRAILLGLLLPDPVDPLCPDNFKTRARELLPPLLGAIGASDLDLRKKLNDFIGTFANWDLASNQVWLNAARELVKAAHPEETPLVVDPFAGGGSIPLEALRLGCDAFASDLNPVACLIEKVMLEDIPRHGPELAEELRRVSGEIKAAAEQELKEFYPPDPDGARPIAYLWERTIRCDNCGAEIPLMRSFWLSKKEKRKRALRPNIIRKKNEIPRVEFEIFEPKNDAEVRNGTVSRAKATCLCCNIVTQPERVRAQLREQRGGADVIFDSNGKRTGGARMTAVVLLKEGEEGRRYRLPNECDYDAVFHAIKRLQEFVATRSSNGLTVVPDEPSPIGGGKGAGRAFSQRNYGMEKWSDLFSSRQLLAQITLMKCIGNQSNEHIARLLAFALDKSADGNNSLVQWLHDSENPAHLFARQAIPIVWDFCESAPAGRARGVFLSGLGAITEVITSSMSKHSGQAQIADACESPLPGDTASVWFTDPPYYDAIPYSDLSDFFLIWLKRALTNQSLLRDPFDPNNPLSPKLREAVQDEIKKVDGRPKDRKFFEKTMAKTFAEGRRVLKEDGIGSVVFAHKTTEGWEALLSGMVRGGWVITGSWPLATESESRLRARDSAALATSIHLICRPRSEDADIGDWSDVLRELPARVADWMERLQEEGVRGADLVFACIGPALEIYSRYSKVVDAEDREIPLGGNPEAKEPYKRGYLAYVWEVVGRAALEQVLGTAEARARNGMAGVLEEDSRLTALFLWTIQSTNGTKDEGGRMKDEAEETESEANEEDEVTPSKKKKGFILIYDVARRFAQPLGIHLDDWEGRIIETEKGVVRLLPVSERAKSLFGEEGADVVASEIENEPARTLQYALNLFPDEPKATQVQIRGGRKRANVSDDSLRTQREATTLDRVHAAMLLQKSGRTNALRALLEAEQERGPNFVRLANALSALYPRESEEKRLVDAMLLAVPR